MTIIDKVKVTFPVNVKRKIKIFLGGVRGLLRFIIRPLQLVRYFQLYRLAVINKLFDANYYSRYSVSDQTNSFFLFIEYLEISCFSSVNPSSNFNGELYLKSYPDVYHLSVSPLLHYLIHGKKEGRIFHPAASNWSPSRDSVLTFDKEEGCQCQIAILLHIYYPDFILKFKNYLECFPSKFDLFVSHSKSIEEKEIIAILNSSSIKNLNKVKCYKAQNKGRNFGQMLTEIAPELNVYDLVCHAHSKKSLYSGREQTQWADYNFYYLFGTASIVKSIINIFSNNENLGVYYPRSFWMLPSWVNHWTCNKGLTKSFFGEEFLDFTKDFINYPVGGMFWFRPKAIQRLLDYGLTMDDFPDEPLGADGSILHGIERIIGLSAESAGYSQFYYDPLSANFTLDGSYIYAQYNRSAESIYRDCLNFDVVSFDLFDTLIYREFYFPDYGKYLLGKQLSSEGYFHSADEFVDFRNKSEFELRQSRTFDGDVSLVDVYKFLQSRIDFNGNYSSEDLAELEFDYDFRMIKPRDYFIIVLDLLIKAGKKICITTDTYYSNAQIKKLLDVNCISGYSYLFVSAEIGKRKDSGQIWPYIIDQLDLKSSSKMVHIGDNVHSDSQVPGDLKIPTIHILNPLDKWFATEMGNVFNGQFKSLKNDQNIINESDVLKWGSLMSAACSSPLLSEEGI